MKQQIGFDKVFRSTFKHRLFDMFVSYLYESSSTDIMCKNVIKTNLNSLLAFMCLDVACHTHSRWNKFFLWLCIFISNILEAICVCSNVYCVYDMYLCFFHLIGDINVYFHWKDYVNKKRIFSWFHRYYYLKVFWIPLFLLQFHSRMRKKGIFCQEIFQFGAWINHSFEWKIDSFFFFSAIFVYLVLVFAPIRKIPFNMDG